MQGSWDGAETRLTFELKYCERCGGLWLRPAGGEQIYCVACGRAMAELPPPAQGAEADSEEEEDFWKFSREESAGLEEPGDGDDRGLDRDAAGGVA